jgi:hypothetical protein
MKPLPTKMIFAALGMVALLTGPALAQKQVRQPAQQQTVVSQPTYSYPEANDGLSHSGTASNQFEHDHGYYTGD